MCLRFHTQDDCVEDCPNAVSDVPKYEIPNTRKIAYRNYLKRVRRS